MPKKFAKLPAPKRVREILVEQAEALVALQTAGRNEAIQIARRAIAELRDKLDAMPIQGGFDWVQRQAALSQLRMMVDRLVTEGRELASGAVRVAANRSARYVAQHLHLLDAIYEGAPRFLAFDTLEWAAANTDELLRSRLRMHIGSFARYGARTVYEIEREVVKNIVLGVPWQMAREQILELTRDVVADKTWMVDRILRTETNHAWNATQWRALAAEDTPDNRMFKRIVATLDKKTGRDSISWDGQTRPVNEPFDNEWLGRSVQHPPLRPNDRCIVIGWRESYGLVNPAVPAL